MSALKHGVEDLLIMHSFQYQDELLVNEILQSHHLGNHVWEHCLRNIRHSWIIPVNLFYNWRSYQLGEKTTGFCLLVCLFGWRIIRESYNTGLQWETITSSFCAFMWQVSSEPSYFSQVASSSLSLLNSFSRLWNGSIHLSFNYSVLQFLHVIIKTSYFTLICLNIWITEYLKKVFRV